MLVNLRSLKESRTAAQMEKGDFGHKQGEAEILSHKTDNDVIALVDGVKCKGIFNVFTGAYFIDDVDGRLE
jgi:hypothetical protein